MPTSNSGSPEQLFQEIANSAIKRINLGIAQSQNSSEPIYVLPPLKTLPTHKFHPRIEDIPLKRESPDAKPVRISFHPLTHFATTLNCLPSLTDLDLLGSLSSGRRCGWLTPPSIDVLPLIQPVWLAEQDARNYTLFYGFGTYRTVLRQNESKLCATIWASQTNPVQRRQKGNLSDWQVLLESTTLPALIDIFSATFHSYLFDEEVRAKLIFWLDTLGLLSLIFQYTGKGLSKRAALKAADLPDSTYNHLTRDLRKRQQPLQYPPTPSANDQKQGPGANVPPTTADMDSRGPAMTSTDNATNTEVPPEEEERERSNDEPRYGTPLF